MSKMSKPVSLAPVKALAADAKGPALDRIASPATAAAAPGAPAPARVEAPKVQAPKVRNGAASDNGKASKAATPPAGKAEPAKPQGPGKAAAALTSAMPMKTPVQATEPAKAKVKPARSAARGKKAASAKPTNSVTKPAIKATVPEAKSNVVSLAPAKFAGQRKSAGPALSAAKKTATTKSEAKKPVGTKSVSKNPEAKRPVGPKAAAAVKPAVAPVFAPLPGFSALFERAAQPVQGADMIQAFAAQMLGAARAIGEMQAALLDHQVNQIKASLEEIEACARSTDPSEVVVIQAKAMRRSSDDLAKAMKTVTALARKGFVAR